MRRCLIEAALLKLAFGFEDQTVTVDGAGRKSQDPAELRLRSAATQRFDGIQDPLGAFASGRLLVVVHAAHHDHRRRGLPDDRAVAVKTRPDNEPLLVKPMEMLQ